MTNFNSQNKANNIEGSKKFAPIIVSAVVTLAGAAALLTGCGNDVPVSSAPAAAAVSAVTTSAPKVTIAENKAATTGTSVKTAQNAQAEQIAVKAANNASHIYAANTANTVPVSNISVNADTNTNTNTNADPDNIGVDKETAIANVRDQVGSGAQIISCEKGVSLEGFNCWEIIVAPVTNGNGPERVTFYSGYQFCYSPEYIAYREKSENTQNPMMNFSGTYTNGRAMMTVSCIGNDQVSVHISWAGSAFETSVWDMSGYASICNEGIAFWYDNCTKETFIYSEDGNLLSDVIEYTNGSGSVDFLSSDNNAYWYDAQEGAGSGSSFWFCV